MPGPAFRIATGNLAPKPVLRFAGQWSSYLRGRAHLQFGRASFTHNRKPIPTSPPQPQGAGIFFQESGPTTTGGFNRDCFRRGVSLAHSKTSFAGIPAKRTPKKLIGNPNIKDGPWRSIAGFRFRMTGAVSTPEFHCLETWVFLRYFLRIGRSKRSMGGGLLGQTSIRARGGNGFRQVKPVGRRYSLESPSARNFLPPRRGFLAWDVSRVKGKNKTGGPRAGASIHLPPDFSRRAKFSWRTPVFRGD